MEYKKVEMNLSEVCETAWNLAKKHWLWLALLLLIDKMCAQIVSASTTPITPSAYLKLFSGKVDEFVALQQAEQMSFLTFGFFLSIIITLVLSFYVNLITNRYLGEAVHGVEHVDVTKLITGSFDRYLSYAAKGILSFLAVGAGLIFFFIPGLILAVRLMFIPYLAANHPELSIGETFSRSMEITKGHFWQLLGYGIVAWFINIIGTCCCCIGVFFTQPLTQLMLAHVYMILSGEYDEMDDDEEVRDDR